MRERRSSQGTDNRQRSASRPPASRTANRAPNRRDDSMGKGRIQARLSPQEYAEMAETQVEGRNPVKEALRAGRSIQRILIAEDERRGPLGEIVALAREKQIPVDEVDRETLERRSVTGVHQGVIALTAAKDYAELAEVLDEIEKSGQTPLLLLCDGLQDPHNLGALLRTADACGVHAVVIPSRRSVGLTATVAKTSAGAVEHVPVCRVTNIAQTIEQLKEKGIWVAGAEMDGEKLIWDTDLTGPLAVVVGGEGEGVSRLVAERCDFLVRLPMQGMINSLNASVAGSLMLFEVMRQRHGKQTNS